MDKATKRRLRALAIFVIFLALAWAATQTLFKEKKGPDIKAVFGESSQQFERIPALHRVTMSISTPNKLQAEKQLSAILADHSIKKRKSGFDASGYGAYIFQVREQDYQAVVDKINNIGSGIINKVESDDDSLATLTLATEEAFLQGKLTDRERLDRIESAYGNLYNQKADLEEEIKELENNVVTPLREGDTRWIFLQVMPTPTGSRISLVQKFLINFFGAIIGGFIIVVLAYYGTKLLMYLLSLLGIKGFNSANLGGGYSYGGYGNRYYSRYGYRSGKRKVKRIYKGKPGHSSKEAPEDKEEQKS